jgi:hypothetical protein
VTLKTCGDTGATLGGNKAARRIKTSTPLTPSLWKATPLHVTLRKQEVCQLPDIGSKLAGETFSRPAGEHQGILHPENESKQSHERTGNSKPQDKKRQESESNINSAAHNQTMKQQKQLNDKNHHIPINISTEC